MTVEEYGVRRSHLIQPIIGQMGPWRGGLSQPTSGGLDLLCWGLLCPKPGLFPGSFLGSLQILCFQPAACDSGLSSGRPEPREWTEMATTLTLLVSQEQEARSLHKLQRVATCLTPIWFILSWQTHQWDVLPRRGQAGQPHPSSCHRPQMRAWGGRGGKGRQVWIIWVGGEMRWGAGSLFQWRHIRTPRW